MRYGTNWEGHCRFSFPLQNFSAISKTGVGCGLTFRFSHWTVVSRSSTRTNRERGCTPRKVSLVSKAKNLVAWKGSGAANVGYAVQDSDFTLYESSWLSGPREIVSRVTQLRAVLMTGKTFQFYTGTRSRTALVSSVSILVGLMHSQRLPLLFGSCHEKV